jgi:hypothetical protein
MPSDKSPTGDQPDFTKADDDAADRALDRVAREDAMRPTRAPLKRIKADASAKPTDDRVRDG